MMFPCFILYAQSDVVVVDLKDGFAAAFANLSSSDIKRNLVFHVLEDSDYVGEQGRYRFHRGSYVSFFDHNGILVPALIMGSAESSGVLFAGAYYFKSRGLYRIAVAPTYRISVLRLNLREMLYYYGIRSGKVPGRGVILHWNGVIPADWVSPRKWLRKEKNRFLSEKLLSLSKLLEYSEFLKLHRENPLVPYIARSLYIYCGVLENRRLVRSPLGKSILKKIKSNAEYVFGR